MRDENKIREINEAQAAGERALNTLQQAQENLEKARNWGIWDMVGGGLISTMMKHSRIEDASQLMENAKRDLQYFQRELQDIQVPTQFRMEISNFLTFADFFFDGLIADWMVQSKIADARNQVSDAIRKVEGILRSLDDMKDVIDVDYREV